MVSEKKQNLLHQLSWMQWKKVGCWMWFRFLLTMLLIIRLSIIESKHPHIFWTLCVVHSINLALKSICEPSEISSHYEYYKWILDIPNDIQDIRNFFVNHKLALSIFSSHSDLTLLRISETRFSSHLIMAGRLRKVRTALQKMVMK